MLVPSLMLFLSLMLNLLLLVLCIFDTAKCVSGFPVALTKCYRNLTREIKNNKPRLRAPHLVLHLSCRMSCFRSVFNSQTSHCFNCGCTLPGLPSLRRKVGSTLNLDVGLSLIDGVWKVIFKILKSSSNCLCWHEPGQFNMVWNEAKMDAQCFWCAALDCLPEKLKYAGYSLLFPELFSWHPNTLRLFASLMHKVQ